MKGKIQPSDQLEPGRAVARLTDLGWGQRLRTLLGDDGVGGTVTLDLEAPGIEEDPDAAFDVPVQRSVSDIPPDDELLRACARVLGAWDWKERPGAVVAIPSRRRPRLVTGLAEGLARLGRLPYLGELSLAHGGPTGGPGATAPSGWRVCGSGSSSATSCGSGWPRPARRRSCLWTTWPTPGGR